MPQLRHLAGPARRFAGDDSGVSAVEFALILPLMLTLYLGGVEVTQAVSIDRKVTLVARTVADLTAQASTVRDEDLDNYLGASKAVIVPYTSTPLKVTVSSIVVDKNLRATVDWSRNLAGGTPYAKGADMTSRIPVALREPCATAASACTLIWGEATYEYQPTIGYVITGKLTLSDVIFMKPRLTNQITKG